MADSPRLQTEYFDACTPSFCYQGVQYPAGDALASCALLNPHSLNLSPLLSQNHSAGREGFSFCIARHEETHLWHAKGI